MTIKVAISVDYGGFRLTDEAIARIQNHPNAGLFDKTTNWNYDNSIEVRSNPILIEIVSRMINGGGKDRTSRIAIVEIPDDAKDPYIQEYDGKEWVAEGRCWHASYNDIDQINFEMEE